MATILVKYVCERKIAAYNFLLKELRTRGCMQWPFHEL